MNELPLFDIDIYGSWDNFVEFRELMGNPPIKFNNSLYDDINDLKKDYLISNIKKFVIKDYEINNQPIEEDIGVSIYDFEILTDMITYDNNHLKLITMFYLDVVLVETYNNNEDTFSSKDEYINYKNLNISTLNEIYKLFNNNL